MFPFKKALKRVVKNPWYIPYGVARVFPRFFPDSLFVRLMYKADLGKWPNLKHPRRFTEKLQWIKLHDHNPLYTMLVDKIQVKDYIIKKLGPEYVAKLLGVWNRPEDIDFGTLPDRFVLKCNHMGGGAVLICKDKKTFDIENAKRTLARHLKHCIYLDCREWPYKDITHKIFAEEYMEDYTGQLIDYKLLCFHGKPELMRVASNRFSRHNFNFYDMEGNELLDFHSTVGARNPDLKLDLSMLNEFKRVAAILSEGIPHVRVDLYRVGEQIKFGEMTFFDSAGTDNYGSDELDLKFGSLIHLSIDEK